MPRDKLGPTPFVLQPSDTMIGAEISEIDLRKPLDDSIFYAVAAAFDRYSVVVFRNQDLTPEQRIVFSRRFGPLQVNETTQFRIGGRESEISHHGPVCPDRTANFTFSRGWAKIAKKQYR
jgi:alpha-ketoglutarate-dependent taurine dioxygenase